MKTLSALILSVCVAVQAVGADGAFTVALRMPPPLHGGLTDMRANVAYEHE